MLIRRSVQDLNERYNRSVQDLGCSLTATFLRWLSRWRPGAFQRPPWEWPAPRTAECPLLCRVSLTSSGILYPPEKWTEI